MTEAILAPPAAARTRPPAIERFLAHGGIVITLLVIVVVATAFAEPRFFNRLNLINVARNCALLAIPAMAQMLVMTAGGFDLSIGAVMAAASMVTATLMAAGIQAFPGGDLPVVLVALLASLGLGAATGLFSGALIASFGLSPFIVTLAVTSMMMGVALYLTQGIPIYGILDSFVAEVGRGQVLGLPVIFVVAVLLVAVFVILQRFTAFGRHVYATGSDERAARLSGVRTRRTLMTVYAIAGMLSALTGFLMTSRIGSGQAAIGASLPLETIATAVIGGVSLRGGTGKAEYVGLAAVFLSVNANAMNLTHIDSRFQALVLGAILLVALTLERLLLRRSRA